MLPNEYWQVEYIEASGSQYINTQYYIKVNTVIETQFQYTVATRDTRVYGVNDGSSTNINAVLYIRGSSDNFSFRYGSRGYNAIGYEQGSWVGSNTNQHICKLANGVLTFDGTNYSFSNSLSATCAYPLFIFAQNSSGNAVGHSQCRIWYFKLWEGDTLIGDFVPAMRKVDNAVGLYDTVSNQFFANAGSGSFTHGKIIINEPLNIVFEDNPLPIQFDDNVSLTANFVINYIITLEYDQTLGSASYVWDDDSVILSAVPTSIGQFVGWYINSTQISTSPTFTYTPYQDTTIEARFERVWDIDDRVDGNGAIQYTRGTDKNDVTFSVIPDSHHHFTQYEVQLALSAIFPDGLKSAGSVYDELTESKAITRVGSVTFDGSSDENWNFYEWSSGKYRAYISVPNIDVSTPDTQVANITSNLFPTIAYNSFNFEVNAISGRYNIAQINVIENKATSLTDWRTWLSTNPLTIYYELATPIEEDISIDLSYPVCQGGTEQLLPENGTEPTTSPLLADIQYPDQLRTNQQFTYRECPTTQDGTATIQSLKGNTLVFNQLVQNGNFVDTSGWINSGVTFTVSDNIATVTGSSGRIGQGYKGTPNNVFLLKFDSKTPQQGSLLARIYYGDYGEHQAEIYSSSTDWETKTKIVTSASSGNVYELRLYPNASGNQFRNVQIFNLTTITVDDFLRYFRLPYYSYTQGKLLSFTGTGLKSTGKNLNGGINQVYWISGVTNTYSRNNGQSGNIFETLGATSMTISTTEPQARYRACAGDEEVGIGNVVTGYNIVRADGTNQTITINTSGHKYLIVDATDLSKVQVQFGSTATTYEAYQSSTLYFTTATQYFTETPLYLHLRSDIIITAYFVEDDKFHITASTDFRYGSIYISDNDVYSGTVVTLWARPFPDYNFVQWGDGTFDNPKSITVTSNVTLVAEYQRILESNGIYQYRCFVKDQLDMEGSPKAFMVVESFSVKRDIMTKATSSITLLNQIPENINDGDVLVLYDPKGTFLYNGVINSISDKTIRCSQMQSFYKGTWIYSTSPQTYLEQEIAILLKDYADGKLRGSTWVDQQVAQRLGGITIDYIGSTSVNLPTDDDYTTIDMEDFIYGLYEKYNIILDFEINISGPNYVHIKVPAYTPVKVGNNMYAIQNMSPVTETEETNKLVIFDSNKTYRATYIATKNDIVKEPSSTVNRFEITNTTVVFSDDPEADLVASELPQQMYNHYLSFDLILKNFIYSFNDFKLGGTLDVYYNNRKEFETNNYSSRSEYYDSVLTGYEIEKEPNKNVTEVKMICGKIRQKLTQLITLKKI